MTGLVTCSRDYGAATAVPYLRPADVVRGQRLPVRRMRSAMLSRSEVALNRRAFLGLAAGGLGSLALAHLAVAEENRPTRSDPLAPKQPHHAAKAKAVICL